MRGRDVMVFLHIQKTGGTTFGRHLVRNIRLEQPCYCRAGQKKCTCHRPGAAAAGDEGEGGGGATVGADKGDTWLFSRFSTGWSCGLHADWTELTSCVPAAMERRGGCPANRTLSLSLQVPEDKGDVAMAGLPWQWLLPLLLRLGSRAVISGGLSSSSIRLVPSPAPYSMQNQLMLCAQTT
ncbi:UNVERIFIED_CONTAM: Heparan-sulfate 6-O-sulfotransferase 3 [Gekko kuhli]